VDASCLWTGSGSSAASSCSTPLNPLGPSPLTSEQRRGVRCGTELETAACRGEHAGQCEDVASHGSGLDGLREVETQQRNRNPFRLHDRMEEQIHED